MMSAEKCRICLKENRKLTCIFNIRDSVMISTNIMSLAKVQIHPKDGLPSAICSKCLQMLDACLNFINVCEKSDIKLRSSLQSKLEPVGKKTCTLQSEVGSSSDEICEKQFLDNDSIDLHSDNITLNQAVLCENRIKTNIQKYLVYDDEEVSKIDEKKAQKQQCFTCGKVMSSRFRLKTHLRTHTGERPFSCSYCNKNFSLAQNLKVHLRIHTGEKPLKCNICGETFAQSAGLAVHRRKHTGQTPYKCMLCPRSFRTMGHLQYHIRRHTGEKNFECDTCGRAFITRSDLKQHLTSHTGEKPHVCCVCGLRLTRASHLTRHMRHTHNDHKPFACNQCPSKFTQKGDFEKHKKKHAIVKEK